MGATAGGRALSARAEELMGLLSGFPYGDSGSDRELSFSDLLVDSSCAASARPSGAAADDNAPPSKEEDQRSKTSPGKEEAAWAAPKQQATVAKERWQRRQRRSGGGSRGSCGGSGDGVLLNFYVPGLRLTRSMTAPRPGRTALQPATTGQPAPAKPAVAPAGKARLVTD